MKDPIELPGKKAAAFKAPVFGVSVESIKSNGHFIKKESLPLPLFS